MSDTPNNQTAQAEAQQIRRGFVIFAKLIKPVNLSHGTFYQYDIHFKDGTKGEYLSKSDDQKVFICGQEVEYTLKQQAAGQRTFNKIYPVMQKKGGKFDRDFELYKQRIIVRQHTQKVAADLIAKASPELIADLVKTKALTATLKALSHDLEDDIFRDLTI